MARLFLVFQALLWISCSPLKEKKKKTEPVLLDQSLSKTPSALAEGSGRLLFRDPLPGADSSAVFSFKAELQEARSELVLLSHITGFAQEDGLRLAFRREGEALLIHAAARGGPLRPLYEGKDFFSSGRRFLDFFVEARNGGPERMRVKVYDRSRVFRGRERRQAGAVFEERLLADSQGQLFEAKGRGLLWGFQLKGVRLLEAQREDGESI